MTGLSHYQQALYDNYRSVPRETSPTKRKGATGSAAAYRHTAPQGKRLPRSTDNVRVQHDGILYNVDKDTTSWHAYRLEQDEDRDFEDRRVEELKDKTRARRSDYKPRRVWDPTAGFTTGGARSRVAATERSRPNSARSPSPISYSHSPVRLGRDEFDSRNRSGDIIDGISPSSTFRRTLNNTTSSAAKGSTGGARSHSERPSFRSNNNNDHDNNDSRDYYPPSPSSPEATSRRARPTSAPSQRRRQGGAERENSSGTSYNRRGRTERSSYRTATDREEELMGRVDALSKTVEGLQRSIAEKAVGMAADDGGTPTPWSGSTRQARRAVAGGGSEGGYSSGGSTRLRSPSPAGGGVGGNDYSPSPRSRGGESNSPASSSPTPASASASLEHDLGGEDGRVIYSKINELRHSHETNLSVIKALEKDKRQAESRARRLEKLLQHSIRMREEGGSFSDDDEFDIYRRGLATTTPPHLKLSPTPPPSSRTTTPAAATEEEERSCRGDSCSPSRRRPWDSSKGAWDGSKGQRAGGRPRSASSLDRHHSRGGRGFSSSSPSSARMRGSATLSDYCHSEGGGKKRGVTVPRPFRTMEIHVAKREAKQREEQELKLREKEEEMREERQQRLRALRSLEGKPFEGVISRSEEMLARREEKVRQAALREEEELKKAYFKAEEVVLADADWKTIQERQDVKRQQEREARKQQTLSMSRMPPRMARANHQLLEKEKAQAAAKAARQRGSGGGGGGRGGGGGGGGEDDDELSVGGSSMQLNKKKKVPPEKIRELHSRQQRKWEALLAARKQRSSHNRQPVVPIASGMEKRQEKYEEKARERKETQRKKEEEQKRHREEEEKKKRESAFKARVPTVPRTTNSQLLHTKEVEKKLKQEREAQDREEAREKLRKQRQRAISKNISQAIKAVQRERGMGDEEAALSADALAARKLAVAREKAKEDKVKYIQFQKDLQDKAQSGPTLWERHDAELRKGVARREALSAIAKSVYGSGENWQARAARDGLFNEEEKILLDIHPDSDTGGYGG